MTLMFDTLCLCHVQSKVAKLKCVLHRQMSAKIYIRGKGTLFISHFSLAQNTWDLRAIFFFAANFVLSSCCFVLFFCRSSSSFDSCCRGRNRVSIKTAGDVSVYYPSPSHPTPPVSPSSKSWGWEQLAQTEYSGSEKCNFQALIKEHSGAIKRTMW